MSVPRAPRRAAIAVLLAAMTAASPELAAAARVEPGPGSRPVVPTIPGVPARLLVFVPAVVYVDHPFDVAVWIAVTVSSWSGKAPARSSRWWPKRGRWPARPPC